MAEIVGAFGTPHMPGSPQLVAREGDRCEVGRLFQAVQQHVAAVDPEVLVVFDTDHFAMFFYDNLPTFCVGVAQATSGPGTDDWPGLPSYEVAVDETLGRHLHAAGIEDGFDLALAEDFSIDHSIIVPLHFLNPGMKRPIVPLFVNGIAPPMPRAKRCYALGEMVRRAIEAWPDNTRVAVLASGCFSGDIGGPRSVDGQPFAPADSEWVTHAVGRLARGEVRELLEEATPQRLAAAGNVSGEMLNWIALLGVVGDRKPRFLEPQLSGGTAYGAWRWD